MKTFLKYTGIFFLATVVLDLVVLFAAAILLVILLNLFALPFVILIGRAKMRRQRPEERAVTEVLDDNGEWVTLGEYVERKQEQALDEYVQSKEMLDAHRA